MRAKLTCLSGLTIILSALAAPAYSAEVKLKGSHFLDAVSRNTLSGVTADGVKFNAFFVKGGIVTYMDMTGLQDRGTWRMDGNDDVCVTWQKHNAGKEECFVVTMDGNTVRWKGKTEGGSAHLRGTVTSSFLP
jgi:hypothetical protein